MPRTRMNLLTRRQRAEIRIADAHKRRYGARPDQITWAGETNAFTPLRASPGLQAHWIVDHAGPKFIRFDGEL